ncbi:D-isomer specific 2-hydroxyacid dehydrogenase NAD-binding [Mesotoga infera]|uniref:D-isomer specific 2-hydroxyacid dehydrogenase NAD-binding n=1 Tax=Mesotoga infera TaxID=1236046 RepID=A0A7Z7LHK7_9BACT|nr:2-hydroxyacid dehydrogenase [Mesotoga infera]SSC14101.1 D-isomer specific 2-hydroxyacid dehydrogenase NAD-binding [Mesotoga infera]
MLVLFLNKFDKYWDGKLDQLRKAFPGHDFVSYLDHNDPKELLPEADVLVKGSLSKEELTKAVKLKAVFVPWTGVDGLPLNELKKRSIILANNHGNAEVVAERAIALAMAVTGRVVELHKNLERGVWLGRPSSKEFTWFSILERKCAILGLGQIGQKIAGFLKAFRCRINGFKKEPSGSYPGLDFITNDIKQAVRGAELVFVALPLTSETLGIVNQEVLDAMGSAYLINISRGKVVEEKALAESLMSGKLAGAAIDVWYDYPSIDRPVTLPSRYPIHTLPNVVLSPHVGSWTTESMQAMVDETVESIGHYLLTGNPIDIVDLEKMY